MRNLSLFTGSGIGDWAAAQAGIETVAQCENDPVCQFALRKLWPDAYLFKDVHDVSAQSLRERGLWPIDIISGGFPCVDISTAGRGKGIEGSRSGLWCEMFRVIRQVRPAWLVIENVPVIRVRGVDRVLAPLERIGYTCWPLVVGAWAVGATHKRDRVWIVARHSLPASTWERTSSGMGLREGTTGDSCERTLADGPRQPGDQRPDRDGVVQCGDELADSNSRQCPQPESLGSDLGPQLSATPGSRWPSRPGEPQHPWEAPRLVEFGVGSDAYGLARRILVRLAGSRNRVPPDRAASRANKSLLRILGNGWVPQIPLMIYQWIANQP
jgi:hypothetical protein